MKDQKIVDQFILYLSKHEKMSGYSGSSITEIAEVMELAYRAGYEDATKEITQSKNRRIRMEGLGTR